MCPWAGEEKTKEEAARAKGGSEHRGAHRSQHCPGLPKSLLGTLRTGLTRGSSRRSLAPLGCTHKTHSQSKGQERKLPRGKTSKASRDEGTEVTTTTCSRAMLTGTPCNVHSRRCCPCQAGRGSWDVPRKGWDVPREGWDVLRESWDVPRDVLSSQDWISDPRKAEGLQKGCSGVGAVGEQPHTALAGWGERS